MPLGSEHPIAKQTMTTTDTKDVDGTVDQVMKCADMGADLVRITVQGNKEANACHDIREKLFKLGYDTPLVADIHFQPKVALRVAEAFEKIRVNPGNFADGRKKFDDIDYESEAQFVAEREMMAEMFMPLAEKCKELKRAIRIGTNHGSLSARVLSYYGDTPRGMVNSAFEFADFCRSIDYHNFVFSMKASNPLVMVQAYRLLAAEMYDRNWTYPLHLGVTEAGEGEDGRTKSALGIGALLADGLGDTIRVSLTEDPELEMQPCGLLAKTGMDACEKGLGVDDFTETHRDFKSFERRQGEMPPEGTPAAQLLHRDGTVFTAVSLEDLRQPEALYSALGCKMAVGMPFKDIASTDSLYMRELPSPADAQAQQTLRRLREGGVGVVAPLAELQRNPLPGCCALVPLREALASPEAVEEARLLRDSVGVMLEADGTETREEVAGAIATVGGVVGIVILTKPGISRVHSSRRFMEYLQGTGSTLPVVHHLVFDETTPEEQLVIVGSCDVGALLMDGLGDGILLESRNPDIPISYLRSTSFGMLQGSRMRMVKTDYVSCPSCGRTLFDLQEVTNQIQVKTGHLPGVSIAIMGCIVNGPGEMADADFGYVGTVPGKIDLYVGKEVVKKNIDMATAPDALVDLIKDYGRWVEPSVDEEGEEAEEIASEAVAR